MKRVIWQDLQGYKHAALIKDGDRDEDAEKGIPDGPPPIEDFGWEQFKQEVNNTLVDSGVNTWNDYQHNPQGVQAALNLFKRRLLNFYRYKNGDGKTSS